MSEREPEVGEWFIGLGWGESLSEPIVKRYVRLGNEIFYDVSGYSNRELCRAQLEVKYWIEIPDEHMIGSCRQLREAEQEAMVRRFNAKVAL